MKEEVEEYIAKAYESDATEKLKDVYITTHEPKT